MKRTVIQKIAFTRWSFELPNASWKGNVYRLAEKSPLHEAFGNSKDHLSKGDLLNFRTLDEKANFYRLAEKSPFHEAFGFDDTPLCVLSGPMAQVSVEIFDKSLCVHRTHRINIPDWNMGFSS